MKRRQERSILAKLRVVACPSCLGFSQNICIHLCRVTTDTFALRGLDSPGKPKNTARKKEGE